ncbi:hypothetical protein QUF50_07925 [Thiotrichales bacterium HSG1]|nr:hypothetical protein [Thiotrichales bacterium HSG1]
MVIMGGKILLFLTILSVVSILFLSMSVIKFLNLRNNGRQLSRCGTWNGKGYADNYLEIKTLPIELRKQLAELNCVKGIMSPSEFEKQKRMLLKKFGR